MFRYTRNKLNNLIKKAKRYFMITVFSSKRPKEVWRTIHLSLHPSQQPLRADPDDLNRHFASTAESVTASSPALSEDIYRLIDRLTDDSHSSFRFCYATLQEVLREIKGLRWDCSTGPDNIPANFVKLVAERLVFPLTHINSCLDRNEYPLLWKTARALVRFLRWMSHGQMTITDLSLFYLYYLRFMRNWLSAKSLIFSRRMPSCNLTSVHIGSVTPLQPQCW